MTVTASSLLSMSSNNSIWSIINQYQLFLLLPLMGAYMSDDVIKFITGQDFTILPFSFNQVSKKSAFKLTKYLKCDQDNQYLNDIGFESCSALINITPMVLILFGFLF